MKRLVLIALLCVGASLPPMPRLSPVLRSPKDAANQPVKLRAPQVVAPPVMREITLVWNYPADQISNVVFEVWATTDIGFAVVPRTNYYDVPFGFYLVVTVDQTRAVIQSNLPAQFFIVRAKDRASGKYSPWNQASLNVTGPIIGVEMISPPNGAVVSNTITLEAKVITLKPPNGLEVVTQ